MQSHVVAEGRIGVFGLHGVGYPIRGYDGDYCQYRGCVRGSISACRIACVMSPSDQEVRLQPCGAWRHEWIEKGLVSQGGMIEAETDGFK